MASRLDRICPIFPSRDVAASLGHYRRLGFEAAPYEEVDDDGPIYGFVTRDTVQIHLARVTDLDPLTTTTAAYLYVDDADALLTEWRAAGVDGRFHEAEDTEYGLREFAHVDPDGNLLRVGSKL